VITIAELLDPTAPGELWPRLKQIGVNDVVSLLEAGEQHMRWLLHESHSDDRSVPSLDLTVDEPCWSRPSLERLQRRYEEAGFRLAALEDTPPMDKIRLGLPGREEQIDALCTQIRAMGTLGIPVLCYNWVPVYSWARTQLAVPARGNALVTGYDHSAMKAAPVRPEAEFATEERLWANFEYFLHRVVPVAEEAGVRLALHPDDPPISPVRGLGRIMVSVDAFQRVIDLVPSDCNGITLCQGNFALMTDDLPATIRHFGGQGKVFFVHFRDVQGTPERFVETFHDDGPTDMLACMRAYAEIGFDGMLRPDHVPTLYGEPNDKPGYATLGRLFAIGYIVGLREAAYGGRDAEPTSAGRTSTAGATPRR
jgi:mannonate dehydratase